MAKPLTLAFASSVISNFRAAYLRSFDEVCNNNLLSDQEVLDIFNEWNSVELPETELAQYPRLHEESEYDQAVLAEMHYTIEEKTKAQS